MYSIQRYCYIYLAVARSLVAGAAPRDIGNGRSLAGPAPTELTAQLLTRALRLRYDVCVTVINII